ncbi:MAG: carbohydrate ABC transporter permease [Bacillota bacterium]
MRNNKRFMRLMTLPALLVFLFLGVYPTIQAFYNSLTYYKLTEIGTKKFVFLDNYIQMFTNVRFWEALGRTVIFVVASVFFTYLLGLIISIVINQAHKCRNLFRIIFLIPMIIAPTITALNFKFMYNNNFGIFNHILNKFGFGSIDFLGDPSVSLLSTLLVDIWQGVPMPVLILLAGLESLSESYYEAARLDGASSWQCFRYITFPLLNKFSVIVIILRAMDSLKVYENIQLLTSGGPGTSSETLNIYITKVGFNWFDMGYASALGIFTLYFIMFITNRIVKATGIFSSKEMA